MKKVLRLWVNGKGYEPFEYEIFDDISNELKERNIAIGNGSSIGYGSSIGNNLKVKTLFFCGSNHSVSYWGEDKIQIGCQSFTISEWENNFKIIGIKHNYSEEQIKEYEYYINAIRQFHNHLNP